MHGYKCDHADCKKDADFECGFSDIDIDFECSGDLDFTHNFCLEHFKEADGSANLVNFRKLDRLKTFFEYECSIPYYLENILKEE